MIEEWELFIPTMIMIKFYSMINKNPEADTGFQSEDQKNKSASHRLFPLPQFKMAILPPGILRMRLTESCLLPYIPLKCWD